MIPEFEIGQEGTRTDGAGADALPIEAGSWTLVVMPDTQHYSQTYPVHFNNQTQWIADHAVSHNIKYVLHEGDIVNVNTNTTQWANARAALDTLNGVVPYALAPGNHDYGPSGNASTRDTLFHQPNNFGPGTPYAPSLPLAASSRRVRPTTPITRSMPGAKTGLRSPWNSGRATKSWLGPTRSSRLTPTIWPFW